MYELIGCPMHLGVSDEGLKNSINVLNDRFENLQIRTIDEIICDEDGLRNLKNLNSIVATCEKIAEQTDAIIKKGNKPLFIGGDHSSSMGTVSGVSANYEHLGVIWIDSHSDINTDVTTITGNIHGMPVSALMGFGNEKLTSIYGEEIKVLPKNFVIFGVRDMDPLEKEIVERLDIRVFTYDEIMELGVEEAICVAKDYLSSVTKLHISFDLDSMNPDLIKGVTVPVKSGFDDIDILKTFDCLLKNFEVSSIDIVEYNPKYDSDLYTGEFTNLLVNKIQVSDIWTREM